MTNQVKGLSVSTLMLFSGLWVTFGFATAFATVAIVGGILGIICFWDGRSDEEIKADYDKQRRY